MIQIISFKSTNIVKKESFLIGVFLCLSLFLSATSKEYTVEDASALYSDIRYNTVDTFILSESGIYDGGAMCRIYDTVVVMAKEGLPTKPIMKYATQTNAVGSMFQGYATAQVTFIGVEFDLSGTYSSILYHDYRGFVDLKLLNCYIHDGTSGQGTFRFNNPNSSLTMDYCFVSGSGAVFLYFYIPSVDYGEVNISNTTFSNMGGDVIYYRTAGGAYGNMNNITFDHCTFKSVASQVMSYDADFVQAGATARVTNCILIDVEKLTKDDLYVSDYNYLGVNTATAILTETNTFTTAPVFAEASDTFRIINTSDFICADGSFAGDMSWYLSVSVLGVSINKETVSINTEENTTLSVNVTPYNATNKVVIWGTTDTSIATVTNGLIIGVSAGITKIWVQTIDGDFTDTCTVTVQDVSVTGISLNKSAESIYVGGTITLLETIIPENATEKSVIWGSTNMSIATVVDGLVSSVAEGQVKIWVKTVDSGYTDTCTIKVIPISKPVIGVSLDQSLITINVGIDTTLVAAITPNDATVKEIIWGTTDASIATVINGLVTGVSVGVTKVWVKTLDGKYTDTCTVSVETPSFTSVVAIADSYIIGGSNADVNYGIGTLLMKYADANESVRREIFFKFDLSGLPAELKAVTLKLTSTNERVNNFEAFLVEDDSWTEAGLTFNNAPDKGVSLGIRTNTVSNPVLEWNIRAEVLDELAKDQMITIKLTGTTNNNVISSIYSREATIDVEKPTIYFEAGEFVSVSSVVVDVAENTSSVEAGSSLQMTSVILPNNASFQTLKWSVVNGTGAAIISTTGSLIGIAEGSVTVKATATDGSGVLGQKIITVMALAPERLEIVAIADAYIVGGSNADTNYDISDLLMKQVEGNESDTYESYLKFDLSDLPSYLDVATLNLTVKDANINSFEAFIVANDSWTESTINWNNAPSMGASLGIETNTVTNPVLEWNITTDVLAELASDSLITIKVVGKENNVLSSIYSKETAIFDAQKPIIYYEIGIVPPMDPDANQSEWVYLGANDELVYKTDYKGNRIMDFSSAGYMGGGIPLPEVHGKVMISPSGGDDFSAIQSAIDQVAAMPIVDGFRGAVVLSSGTFQTSGTININASGIVVRGSGSGSEGTHIKVVGDVEVAFLMSGSDTYLKGKTVDISQVLLSSGAMSLDVSDASDFSVGENVLITKIATEEWIAYLGMDNLVRDGEEQTWISPNTELTTDRTIVSIDGNTITLNAPVADVFDAEQLGLPIGKVCSYTFPGRINQCGLENLKIEVSDSKISSNFNSVQINKAKDCWVKDVEILDGVNNFLITKDVRQVTIDKVVVRHTLKSVDSAAPGDFACTGTQVLFSDCSSYGSGSWAFVTHSGGSGPIVLLNFYSEQERGIAPHMRWTTGVLADNCVLPYSTEGIAYRNRSTMGSGHGWTTGWSVAWNVETPSFLNAQAPGTINWVIGGHGAKETAEDNPQGVYDKFNTTVSPSSLYMAQLRQRYSVEAPTELIIKQQYKQNDLWWTDNASSETEYIVEKSTNGKMWETLVRLPVNTNFYSDTTLEGSYTFYYRVKAVNIATYSEASNTVLVYDAELINPLADASVSNMTSSNTNYGTDTILSTLIVTTGYTKMVYLKFDLSVLPKDLILLNLRLKAKKTSVNTVEAFFVEDDSWEEQSITWNNKPQTSTSLGHQSSNEPTIFEWNILDLVNSEMEGDKVLSVALSATELNKSLDFYSREGATDNTLFQPSLTYKSSSLREYLVLEDAYVCGGSNSDANYGNENELAVKSTQTTNNESKLVYLKFDLSDLPEDFGNCKLILRGVDPTENSFGLYKVSDNSWSENSITWNNKPEAGSLLDTDSNTTVEFVEFDITEEVKTQLNEDRILSVQIASLLSNVSGSFISKEGAERENFIPVIVVEEKERISSLGIHPPQSSQYGKKFQIYPNPANEKIFISNLTTSTNVKIFNLSGQLVMENIYQDCMDISSLNSGMYFIALDDGLNTNNLKFIKQ